MGGGHGVRNCTTLATAEQGHKIACAVNEVDHLDSVAVYSIDKPIVLHKQLADVWIVFLGNDAATLSELP